MSNAPTTAVPCVPRKRLGSLRGSGDERRGVVAALLVAQAGIADHSQAALLQGALPWETAGGWPGRGHHPLQRAVADLQRSSATNTAELTCP